MSFKKTLSLVGSLLAASFVVPTTPDAHAGRTMVLVVTDNKMKERVTCEVYRKDDDRKIATLRYRAKKKHGRVFAQPNDEPTVYLKCGPSGKLKKMRVMFDTAKAKTHRITVGCYTPGGCHANQRKNPKPKGGRKA